VRTFWIGNVLGIVMGFGLFGINLIMPLFFQNALGFTAWDTGLALLPGAIASAISMLIVGRILNFFDPRLLVGAGMLGFGISAWWLGYLNQFSGYWDVFWPRALQGFALGFLFVPLSTVTLGAVPRPELANASGLSTLLRQLGGSLGIAILTTLLAREIAVAYESLSAGVTQTHGASISVLTQLVTQNATVISYDYLFRVSAIVFFVCLPFVFFMRPSRGAAPPAPA
ncbi:MAG: MFS transporter, partial [Candidatus Eremiobacteraeota bacterium]|nr:MFS transporter [Candidatus Eremiobacteraeota bacterium]